MKYTENSINILTVVTYKGIGRAWVNKNLKGNEDVEKIVSLLKNYKKINTTIEEFEERKRDIVSRVSALENFCDGIVALGDKNFPEYRGTVDESERPIFLFYKGDIDLLNIWNKNITVIGLLNPDKKIIEREKIIVTELVKRGATIVSGLAFGCDSIAHEQALSDGKTIAILPSPLNNILPTRNLSLAYRIVEEGGLLISEYYDTHKSLLELNVRYKERDRLQALFCDAIVLIASYAKDSAARWGIYDKKLDSGARLAMGYAKNYGIQRAVMYDPKIDANNPMFDLNREIIQEKNDVIIVNNQNLEDAINKIMSNVALHKAGLVSQGSLFDFS